MGVRYQYFEYVYRPQNYLARAKNDLNPSLHLVLYLFVSRCGLRFDVSCIIDSKIKSIIN